MAPAKEVVEVAKEDAWIKELDLKEFGREMRELGDTLLKGQGEADVAHLDKILLWNHVFTFVGLVTVFLRPNPITVICLSTALYSRWAIIGHHVCHGGFDNTSAAKRGFNRWVFAVGSVQRRVIDWLDWFMPEAWNVEHGRLHHYSLNEAGDPDLVQMNTKFLRELQAPMFVKYFVVLFFALTWKWSYYSSTTYSHLLYSETARATTDPEAKKKLVAEKDTRPVVTVFKIFEGTAPSWWSTRKWLSNVVLPFLVFRFVVIPLPVYMLLGEQYFVNTIINLVLAELLTNVHAFLTIVTNHAGSDLYYFESHCDPKSPEFYLRQVIGSTDYAAGTDPIDFFHGFLNYQVEHHLWPSLSMLSYQRAHPLTKEICKKYGVPFVQNNVFYRLYKTVQIFVGNESMRLFPDNLLNKEE